jgi:ABC-type multidrug transport system permease subunit
MWLLFIYYCLSISWVIFLALISPNGEIALAISSTSVAVLSLFSGFIITRPDIPPYWIWMYYFNFFRYALESLVVNEMKNNSFGCPNGKGAVEVWIPSANTTKQFCPISTGEQMLLSVDFSSNNRIPDMGITIGFWLAIVIACYFALRFIRHIKR